MLSSAGRKAAGEEKLPHFPRPIGPQVTSRRRTQTDSLSTREHRFSRRGELDPFPEAGDRIWKRILSLHRRSANSVVHIVSKQPTGRVDGNSPPPAPGFHRPNSGHIGSGMPGVRDSRSTREGQLKGLLLPPAQRVSPARLNPSDSSRVKRWNPCRKNSAGPPVHSQTPGTGGEAG